MKKVFFIAFLSISQLLFSQDKGTVNGLVTDKDMGGEPLPFANVLIKGTSIGANTDMDGKYTLAVPAGQHTLVFSFVGYQTVEKAITVVAGKTLTINQEMGANEGVALEEVEIKATVGREKESALLLQQKKATTIETTIGAQEISRKGVSDVATAVTKTTGISKQEGSGSVFVRGLGDRYNITTLNGLPLPSNNPSKKNIDLGMFSTDIVEFVSIDKTYNVQNYGDFAGANIDIASKNYKGNGFFKINVASGLNSEAMFAGNFYLNEGPNFSGFYKTNYPAFPVNNYNFENSWDREGKYAPVNSSISLMGGDSFNLADETKLNIFAVASFDNSFKYKEGVARGDVNVSGVARKNFDRKGYFYDTNTTFMGNLRLKHKSSEFKYNGLFINTSSQSHDEYKGVLDIFDTASEGGAIVQRGTFQRNSLFVHQLLGNHKIGEQFNVDWGASYNFNKNNVPDRTQSTVLPVKDNEPNGSKSFRRINNDSDNHRFFSDLEEEEIAVNLNTTFNFSKNEDEEFLGKVVLGYSGRFKNVDFDATQFNFSINNSGSTAVQQPILDPYNLDSYFNQENFDANLFEIRTFRGGIRDTSVDILNPQTYGGDQTINAGFVSLEYKFSPNFTMLAGLRGEKINQTVGYNTSINTGESELDDFQILPMLSLKYKVNEDNNLKFAASKTYTLPQYKERAPFLFEDVVNTSIGNPDLYSSNDYNVDLKWEFFPERNEIISLGTFGKYIENPINEITINSASNDISFVNSGDWGYAIGAEFEIRKKLFGNENEEGDEKSTLTSGLNASYMYDKQKLSSDKVAEETTFTADFSNTEDGFTGASDLLLNADLTFIRNFSENTNLQATTVFNYFSDRIFALGTEGKGNLINKGYGTLDLVLKSQLNEHLTLGLSAKNLLNPTIKTIQEQQNTLVTSYKAGVNVKFSVSYNF